MSDYPDGYVEAHLPDYPDAPERTPPVDFSQVRRRTHKEVNYWLDQALLRIAALEQEQDDLLDKYGPIDRELTDTVAEVERLRAAMEHAIHYLSGLDTVNGIATLRTALTKPEGER